MAEFQVGRSRITKVAELDLNGFPATQLLPTLLPDALRRHPDWLPPGTYDAANGHALLSVHTWVLRHAGRTILVDTGVGNGKPRPTMPVLDRLDGPFLQRLAAAGVRPADVDAILLTHLHADHVGWNTSAVGDRWVPTFPNAEVVCSALEWRYGAALAAGDAAAVQAARDAAGLGEPVRIPVPGVLEDSLRPIEATGRLRLVDMDEEVLPGLRFLPAPGHSIDHAVIELRSEGAVGLFGGDLMHHPVEVHDPDLVSMFCEFPDATRRSRRRLLDHAATTGALYFSGHFTGSSAGHVERDDGGYRWTPA